MPAKPSNDDPELAAVLVRFDAALGRAKTACRALAPGAKHTQISWVGQQIGARVPRGLRQLLTWHNGERGDGGVFHALLAKQLTDTWSTWNEAPFAVRFLSTTGIASEGAYEAVRREDGTFGRAYAGGPAPNAKLMPFVSIRSLEQQGAASAWSDGEGDDDTYAGGSSDDDWLIAVDDLDERIHLFEIGNQGLEGVALQASSMTDFLTALVERVERGEVSFSDPKDEPRQEVDAARLLLEMLVARNLLELEADTEAVLAERLRPLLQRKPKKRAVQAVLASLADDEAVAEIYAPDEALATIIAEFVE